ncbi:MAG TPA: Panacea domain-containing protein [Terracidiphilus sp.]|nr:Panacea domain-containing protein [Terracidiphilus sp.]
MAKYAIIGKASRNLFGLWNVCGKHTGLGIDRCTMNGERWSQRFAVAVHRTVENASVWVKPRTQRRLLPEGYGERVMADFQQHNELRTDGEERLAELILYISQECASDPKFGAIKLNKILYFSDFLAYGTYGRGITGVPYSHREHGPAPQRLRPIRRYLEAHGALIVKKVPLQGGKEQHRTIALRNPDMRDFRPDDIAIVKGMIKYFWDLDADESSDLSHQMVGYKITEMDEDIPYKTIFFSDPPLTSKEEEYARMLVERGRDRGLPVELPLG